MRHGLLFAPAFLVGLALTAIIGSTMEARVAHRRRGEIVRKGSKREATMLKGNFVAS
jgi:hypothetical protein